MSKLYTNIRLLAVMAILSMALPGAFALKTTNLYLAEGSSAILMDYSYTDGDFVMRSTLSPGDNIVELKDYSHVYIFPAPGVETITVTPEDDCMKFVDDTRRGKKYYDVYASSKLQEKYTVTTSGGSAQLPTATVRLAPGSKARVLEKNERTLEYVPYKELAEGDNAVELMMESELVPGTVPFYYLCGEENYVLDVVTDGDGNNIEIKQDSFLGNYIELTAFNYKTEYNVTTKERPDPQGDPVFILSDGSHAYYKSAYGGGAVNLNPGDNYAELDGPYYIFAAEGFHWVSFKDKDNNDIPIDPKKGCGNISTSWGYNPPYYITTAPNEGPDPTFTINIDDVNGIECYMLSNNKTHLLRPGKNTFSFNGYIEDSVLIGREGWENYSPLYSVKVNGEEQSPSYQHMIRLEDGMVIDVIVNYPEDKNCVYTFEYSDGAENFWTSILVDGKETTPVDNKIEVLAGKKVELLNTNADNWKINSITLPDNYVINKMKITDVLSFTARNDDKVKVDASPAVEVPISITIDTDADQLKVMNGDWNTGHPVKGLRNGHNNVIIKDNRDFLMITHVNEAASIHSVQYRPTPDSQLMDANKSASFPYYYTASGLREGAEVFIYVNEQVGIEGIAAEIDSDSEWYTLAGQRVNRDNLVPGIYIRRHNGTAAKVTVK